MSGKDNKPAEEKADINMACQSIEAQQDWFISKNLIKHRYNTVPFPSREGVYAKLLCNKELFEQLHHDFLKVNDPTNIEKNRESIDIVSYDFDPSLCLLGPNGLMPDSNSLEEFSPLYSRLGGNLVHKADKMNHIRLLTWKYTHVEIEKSKAEEVVQSAGNFAWEYTKGMTSDLIKAFRKQPLKYAAFMKNFYSTSLSQMLPSADQIHESNKKQSSEVFDNFPENDFSKAGEGTITQSMMMIPHKAENDFTRDFMMVIMEKGGKKSHIETFEKFFYDYGSNQYPPFYMSTNEMIPEGFNYDIEVMNLFYQKSKEPEYKYDPDHSEFLNHKQRSVQEERNEIKNGAYVVTDIGIAALTPIAGAKLGATMGAVGGSFAGPLGTAGGTVIGVAVGFIGGYILTQVNSYHKGNNNKAYAAIKDQTMLEAYELNADSPTKGEAKSLELKANRFNLLRHNMIDNQSFIVINGANPKQGAVSYVMGHQLTKRYYDNNNHHVISNDRWPGYRPVQVVSVRLEGEITKDLYRYFRRIWKDRIKFHRALKEYTVTRELNGGEYKVKAQICQTDPRYSQQLIFAQYLRAISNACHYLYFEMEHFHYATIAEHLRNRAKEREGKAQNELHLFVVTNANIRPEMAQSSFDTLQQLGYTGALPAYRRKTAIYLYEHYKRAKDENLFGMPAIRFRRYYKHLQNRYPDWLPASRKDFFKLSEEELIERLRLRESDMANSQSPEFDPKYNRVPDGAEEEAMDLHLDIEKVDGMNIVIASLKVAESYAERFNKKFHYYIDVDVQSKLLIVDDAFASIGSANVSISGLKGNSELNVGIESQEFASSSLERLWEMHAHQPPTCMKDKDYVDWMAILKINWSAMQNQEALRGKLFPYYNPDIDHTELKDLY